MRKLMWFTVGFALAAAVGVYFLPPGGFLLAAGICAVLLTVGLLFLLRDRRMRLAAVVLFGSILGFLWLFGFEQIYLSVPRAADGMKEQFTVYATDYSKPTEYGGVCEGVIFLNEKPYQVRVYLAEGHSISPGDRYNGYFTLRCTLSGCSGEEEYQRGNGVFLTAYPLVFNSVEPSEKMPWYGYPAAARRYIQNMFQTVFPDDVSGFARALFLGDGDALDYETDTAFKVSGIRHIIAVSGLHVSILFSFLFFLTGRRSWLATLLGIPVLFAFAAIAGFSPSIVRACVMHALMALALLFRKEYDPPSALSFAALMLLLCNPWVIASVSFQLSFGCLVGILLFTEPIKAWILDKTRVGKWKGISRKLASALASSVAVSISASVITSPLCAIYFGMVSLVSVLTNLLTLWLVTLVFYGIVIITLMGIFSAAAATAAAWVVAWPMRYILLVSKAMASIPMAAVYMDSPYVVAWLILTYILLAVLLLMKGKRPVECICCISICLCIACFASWAEPLGDECRVTVLDVGQGQCILLQSEGKNYLVDCGGDSEVYAADLAAGTLLSQGIRRLDGLILTHYDADHAAGAALLLSRVPADALYLPDCADSDGYSQALMGYAHGTVQLVQTDLLLSFGGARISLIPSEFGMTDNESGLCVLFQTKNYDILITGDRGFTGEKELLQHMTLPQLEVLIVGHHGSKYSTGEPLLEATQPAVAIISVSADNQYGHPTAEVLARLEAIGCKIYRTDQNGTVVFRG